MSHQMSIFRVSDRVAQLNPSAQWRRRVIDWT
jgi:hypothetical protein